MINRDKGREKASFVIICPPSAPEGGCNTSEISLLWKFISVIRENYFRSNVAKFPYGRKSAPVQGSYVESTISLMFSSFRAQRKISKRTLARCRRRFLPTVEMTAGQVMAFTQTPTARNTPPLHFSPPLEGILGANALSLQANPNFVRQFHSKSDESIKIRRHIRRFRRPHERGCQAGVQRRKEDCGALGHERHDQQPGGNIRLLL